MRISGLSRATGVPVATIKYYLREGLLFPGTLTSSTQAQYDEAHAARLRLIRALLGPAGLSITQVREVLHIIDDPGPDMFTLLGRVQLATAPRREEPDIAAALELIASAGWQIDADCPEVRQLAAALAGLAAAGFVPPEGMLERYAAGMDQLACAEIAHIPTASAEAAVRYTVLGTLLIEPVLLALRRLAQQDAARRRFGAPTTG
ncbi:MAG: MerR family transcriptional regulator [Steroidobacteraceae bacterium]